MATARIPVELAVDSKKFRKDIDKISKVKLKLDDRGFRQPLGRITGDLSEFQKSLEASNARVVAFAASAGILYKLSQAFNFLVKSTVEVEKQLKDINVVLGASDANLKKFGNSLFQIAAQTGQSFKVVAESATEFSRQGLGMEKTLKRTADAMILARLSGMDVVDATNALTAAVNSFSSAALNTTQVVNKLAAVDAAFAVSSNDLAEALKRSAASAQAAGVSLDELLALTTAVQERTARGGAVIGNSFKTIFTRIQRPEVLNQLRQLNVQVFDIYGNTQPAIKVLQSLARQFDNMTASQKANTSELVGGVFQVNNLKAALADLGSEYSKYNQAVEISKRATSEANRRNEELNKTLSAQANRLSQQATALAQTSGDLLIRPTIERGISISDFFLGDIDKGTSGAFGQAGETIGKGILGGLGKFLAGPGAALATIIAGKLLLNFVKFSAQALGDFIKIGGKSKEILSTEAQLRSVLTNNLDIVKQIQAGTMSRAQAERQIVEQMKIQNALQRQIAATSAIAAPGVAGAIRRLPGRSSGHIPAFSHGFVPAGAAAGEIAGAFASGYTPGRVRSTNIPGMGKVVYNSREKVKQYPGMAQPAIIPPAGSKAGVRYRREFKKTHGFTPAAGGAVPNPFGGLSDISARRDLDSLRMSGFAAMSVAQKQAAGFQYGRPTGAGPTATNPSGLRLTPINKTMIARIEKAYGGLLKGVERGTTTLERERRIREGLTEKYKLSDKAVAQLETAYRNEKKIIEKRIRAASSGAPMPAASSRGVSIDPLSGPLDPAGRAAEAKEARAQKRRAIGAGLAIAAPILAEFANQQFRKEEIKSGEDALFNQRLSAGTGAVGQVASMAAIGSIIAPGIGTAVGAGAGLLMSAPALMEAFGSNTTVVETNLKLLVDRFNDLNAATTKLEKGILDVRRVFENPGDIQQGAKVIADFVNTLADNKTIPETTKKEIKTQLQAYVGAVAAADPAAQKASMKLLFGDDKSPGIIGGIKNKANLEMAQGTALAEFSRFKQYNIKNIDTHLEEGRGEAAKKARREAASRFVTALMTAPSGTKGPQGMPLSVQEALGQSGVKPSDLKGMEANTGIPKLIYQSMRVMDPDFRKQIKGTEGGAGGIAGVPGMAGEGGKAKFMAELLPAIDNAVDTQFIFFSTLKDAYDALQQKTSMTTEEFSRQVRSILESYQRSMDAFAIGLTSMDQALKIQLSDFTQRSANSISLASQLTDPRDIARANFTRATTIAGLRSDSAMLKVAQNMVNTQSVGNSVVNAIRPFAAGEKAMETLIPQGTNVDHLDQQKVLEGFKRLVELAPLQQGESVSVLSKEGFIQRRMKNLAQGTGFFNKQLGVGAGSFEDTSVLGLDTTKLDKTAQEEVAEALKAFGLTKEGGDLLRANVDAKRAEIDSIKELIIANGEAVKATKAAGAEFSNTLKKIQQDSMISFGGGLQSFKDSSAIQKSLTFQVRAARIGNTRNPLRTRGLAALDQLESYASVARMLDPSAMSRDTLDKVGRQEVINAQTSELSRLTRNMGFKFSGSDLRRAATTQVDAMIKPSDADLIIDPVQSTAKILDEINNNGIDIKNVDAMAKAIVAAIDNQTVPGSPTDVPKHVVPAGKPAIKDLLKKAGGQPVVDISDGGQVREAVMLGAGPAPFTAGKGTPDKFPMLRAGAEGFFKGGDNIDDMFSNFGGLMTELGNDLRTGFKGALKEAIFEAESFSDALRMMSVNILDALADKIFSSAIDSMFNAVGNKLMTGSKGGYVTNSGIQRFASGGMVKGGSGFRDDVPAMLSQGEFVIRKSAVDKYGSGFLNTLNRQGGGAVISASSRIVANDPKRPTDFKYNFSPNLSSLAITDEERPDVRRRRDLADRIFRNNAQYQRAKQAYKQEQRGRLIQGYMSAAMTMGSYAMTYGFNNPTFMPGQTLPTGATVPTGNVGGFVRKYNSGGYVDDIPALLMGGEMVMNRDAVNKHGRGFFEKLNRGSLEGMAEGGMVGGFSTGSSSGSGDSVVQLFDRLITSNESLASVIEESNKGGGPSGAASSANNNVTINVNIDKAGVKSDSQTSSENNNAANASGGMKADEEKAARMGEEIRMACLDVIINEKRPGGALSDFGVGGR